MLATSIGCSTAESGRLQSLFNGRDLSGWQVQCKPADQGHDFWKVQDGAIVADSMGHTEHDYVWLTSRAEYDDFVLRLKFQVDRDCPGNSGVQIRSRYDLDDGWLDGPQVDINPPGPWRTGMIWDETRDSQRWLYPDIPQGQWVEPGMAVDGLRFYYSDDTPAWNDLQITAHGPHITVVLNGLIVTDYDGTGVLDDETHQTRGVGMNGHLALQIHTRDQVRIRFKDITLRKIER